MSCVEVVSTVVNEDKIEAALCLTQGSVFIGGIKNLQAKRLKVSNSEARQAAV